MIYNTWQTIANSQGPQTTAGLVMCIHAAGPAVYGNHDKRLSLWPLPACANITQFLIS